MKASWLNEKHNMFRFAKRIIILVFGMTLLLLGVIMLVTPGPGWGVIFAGLAILATEYAWARRWLRALRDTAEKGAEKLNLRSFFKRK
jgi:tellurite resistance protein TerC